MEKLKIDSRNVTLESLEIQLAEVGAEMAVIIIANANNKKRLKKLVETGSRLIDLIDNYKQAGQEMEHNEKTYTFEEAAIALGVSVEFLIETALNDGLIDSEGQPTELAIKEGLLTTETIVITSVN
jgi:nitrogen-specific signal transduction histidine kinase